MRRFVRLIGTLMILGGLGSLGWSVLVWQWQDPVTAVYEWREQNRLDDGYAATAKRFALPAPEPASAKAPGRSNKSAKAPASASPAQIRAAAKRYRLGLPAGEGLGVLTIDRLGLRKVVVNGTKAEMLERGPGRDPRTAMPGEGKLVYVAGHRTTYGAPFSEIEDLRPGDVVTLEVPYATFTYRITEHVIVPATALDRLKDRGREELALQACHPRFFASHRYIAYAKLVKTEPRDASDPALET